MSCICQYCSVTVKDKYKIKQHQASNKCQAKQREIKENELKKQKEQEFRATQIANYINRINELNRIIESNVDRNLVNDLKVKNEQLEIFGKSKDTEILNLKLQLMRYSTLLTTYETELKEVKEWKNNIIKELEKKPSSKKIIKKLSLILRTQVWNRYIGLEKGLLKCPYCITHNISQLDFECGHIISRENNGSDDLSNLRPICNKCNKSLGKETLDIKKWDDGYDEQFDPVIIFDE